MNHPPGTIGILSAEESRYSWFHQDMMASMAYLPEDTQIVTVVGQWIASAVNGVIERMRPQDAWVSVYADDHRFNATMLTTLLDHQLPLVAPLVCLRMPPFPYAIFHEREGGFYPYSFAELAGKQGLLPVDTFGGPMAVIRREVIEAVGHPFFECMPGSRVLPQEDLYTFSKCRRAGFQPMVDLDLAIGHCKGMVLYPARHPDGRYGVQLWAGMMLGTIFYAPGEEPVTDPEARGPSYL